MNQVPRLYDTPRWRRLRATFLSAHPLCSLCLRIGHDTAATVVDHIQPHKGDVELFWSVENLQSLCAPCHSAAKKIQENYGFSQAADANGFPIDAGHPWNQK